MALSSHTCSAAAHVALYRTVFLRRFHSRVQHPLPLCIYSTRTAAGYRRFRYQYSGTPRSPAGDLRAVGSTLLLYGTMLALLLGVGARLVTALSVVQSPVHVSQGAPLKPFVKSWRKDGIPMAQAALFLIVLSSS